MPRIIPLEIKQFAEKTILSFNTNFGSKNQINIESGLLILNYVVTFPIHNQGKIMKKSFLIISTFFYLTSGFLFAQNFENQIHGYVKNSKTGEPVEYVNVYIAHTTIGAATDHKGYFIINSIPPGTHQLAVSAVGYKFITEIVIINEKSNLLKNFKFSPETYQTETIKIEGLVPDKWLSDLKSFKRLFLGDSRYASECVIKNQEIIEFHWETPKLLKAKAPKPLTIINNYLGYEIHCVLEDFYWNKENERWGWTVIPKFTELEAKDNDQKEQWIENREEAYNGSLSHFLFNLVNKQLQETGYDIANVPLPGDKVLAANMRYTFPGYDDLFEKGENPSEVQLSFNDCIYVRSRNNSTQLSWIVLKNPPVIVDKFGYPKEIAPFVVYGYWSGRGIADHLPKYFIQN